VYNTQNYWVSQLCPSSWILLVDTRKHNVWKLDLLPPSGEGREPFSWVSVQWLILALSTWSNRVWVSLTSPEDGNRSSFRNAVFSSVKNSGCWTKSRNPVILNQAFSLQLSHYTIWAIWDTWKNIWILNGSYNVLKDRPLNAVQLAWSSHCSFLVCIEMLCYNWCYLLTAYI
jgi:hypothetical protein